MITDPEFSTLAMVAAQNYVGLCDCQGKDEIADALKRLIVTCAAGIKVAVGPAESVSILEAIIAHIKKTPQTGEIVQ